MFNLSFRTLTLARCFSFFDGKGKHKKNPNREKNSIGNEVGKIGNEPCFY